MIFQNRTQAGTELAKALKKQSFTNPLVLGLARGGVPVAKPVADALQAELGVLVVRKIGIPGQEELGAGAITEEGTILFNEPLMKRLGLTEKDLSYTQHRETEELHKRIQRFRRGLPLPSVKGRDVILVDDGLATGFTAATAATYIRSKHPKRIILAVPVGAEDSVDLLKGYVNEVVCLQTPKSFYGVGQWYERFDQTSDEEVLTLLETKQHEPVSGQTIQIIDGRSKLPGIISLPENMKGFVLFAHGSGSSHQSPRNLEVAKTLNQSGIGTLLFDLLTQEEGENRDNVFDIPFLARRLVIATEWVETHFPETSDLPWGYFGASTGGGAALWAASELDRKITAVVSRGGRPDMAIPKLKYVSAPTLLVVGGNDLEVIRLNEEALRYLPQGKLALVPGATHVFEEPGALEQVAKQAKNWFLSHFKEDEKQRFSKGA